MAYGKGYCACACDECMEIAIGAPGVALCHDCSDAGCTPEDEHHGECCAHEVRCKNCGAWKDAPEDCVGCEYNHEMRGAI